MWIFVETVRIEAEWGTWSALVTLSKDNVPASFFIGFGANEPTMAEADAAGVALALQKTEDEIVPPPVTAPADFFSRFTTDEANAMYADLDTLESLHMIGLGRAAEIRLGAPNRVAQTRA